MPPRRAKAIRTANKPWDSSAAERKWNDIPEAQYLDVEDIRFEKGSRIFVRHSGITAQTTEDEMPDLLWKATVLDIHAAPELGAMFKVRWFYGKGDYLAATAGKAPTDEEKSILASMCDWTLLSSDHIQVIDLVNVCGVGSVRFWQCYDLHAEMQVKGQWYWSHFFDTKAGTLALDPDVRVPNPDDTPEGQATVCPCEDCRAQYNPVDDAQTLCDTCGTWYMDSTLKKVGDRIDFVDLTGLSLEAKVKILPVRRGWGLQGNHDRFTGLTGAGHRMDEEDFRIVGTFRFKKYVEGGGTFDGSWWNNVMPDGRIVVDGWYRFPGEGPQRAKAAGVYLATVGDMGYFDKVNCPEGHPLY